MDERIISVGPLSKLRGVFYGWWLVGIAMVTVAMTTGAAGHGLGVFFVALERQFGWSRTIISGAFALARLEGTVLGPVEGYFTDRFGTRRIVLVGFFVLGCGFMMFSFSNSILGFYVAFLVVAMGQGLGGFLPLITLANNWFVRRRSMAIAIAGTGGFLGGSLVPVLALGISTVGWRTVSVSLGIFFLLLGFPLTRLIRNRPEEYGLLPDGDSPDTQSPSVRKEAQTDSTGDEDFTARQAMATPAFWLITFSHGLSAMVVGALQVHAIPMLHDAGLSLELAATVVATYTFVAIGSRILGGYLGDRFPKTLVIFAFSCVQATGVLVAVVVVSFPTALLFAVLFGIGWGGRGALFTAIRGDYFGRKAFATIFGLSAFFLSGASVAAPLFAGYIYDTLGSYHVALVTFSIINFLGGTMVLFAKKPLLTMSSSDTN
ncbi:MFS transporter [SAR202 cluster bacterium AC-647-N09_OGT_505m]|nr:MFS transporter [SAR202 cluster bacterium AC-647-N09_OGT_505m]